MASINRVVKSCVYCHHDINETAPGFNGGCNCLANRHKEFVCRALFVPFWRAITSSMKSLRGFIDIRMTVYTRFYSTIHLISQSASGSFDFLKDHGFI